jgi:hypothetical protein
MSEPISPAVAALLERALARVSGSRANQAISEMRIQLGTPERPAFSYEIVLPLEDPIGYLARKVMPRLVYFLDCSGRKMPGCGGMFISIFFGDELFLFRAQDALEEFSKITGLSFEQMVERYGEDRPRQ